MKFKDEIGQGTEETVAKYRPMPFDVWNELCATCHRHEEGKTRRIRMDVEALKLMQMEAA